MVILISADNILYDNGFLVLILIVFLCLFIYLGFSQKF